MASTPAFNRVHRRPLEGTRVRFLAEPLRFRVGPGILGRVFDGVGKVIDGGPPLAEEEAAPHSQLHRA